eukprot:Protomagalhaensia_sp_Gyna_25__974@NODE_1470_length_1808_cov_68_283211_g1190_i0_p1_GENE_NODE_1470_length_1808_cov_68_283211_g1190_i0NODE_1470_length_1808_cov_68_283211_g1190_i0_p1_ORF_typecomplete_len542_score84_16DEAD/PF00270_29/4_4e53DEAD/PF00270_29/2_5e03Helicase_C/PF00271_31/2_4e03Helicase_C/PF00271_31/2_2e31ResIII/PF04851_15/2_6e11ResIII/PF04851_15/5_6e02ERCC3_RAD25_C/PF16203_5/6_5e11AAA_19/PF13245_6/0_0024AAA_19/PF13245_6/63UTP25/PF06862_12/0_0007GRP/PF07172_11/6_5e02GRP/PF07172_11/0_0018Fl
MSSYATSSYASGPYQQAGYGPSPHSRSRSPGGWRSGYGGYSSSTRGSDRPPYDRTAFGSNVKPVSNWQDMPPFRKDFYKESPNVANLSKDQIAKILQEHEIQIVSGGPAPNPIVKFEDAGFSQEIVQRLYAAGFESPSPIQLQAWPIALSGRDMIGIAETGSGKTLAFLLPAVVHIQAQDKVRPDEGPVALILAPTRELVEQIKDEANKFTGRMRTGVAYGGAPRRTQSSMLQSGCEIVAACPGRLIDFLERNTVSMRRVTYLVLDEADRMLDMGFEPQIRRIVGQIRPDRQTLMFSATWPKEVQGLARDLCREDPVHVTIGSTDLKASHNVEQIVEVCPEHAKKGRLHDLLTSLREKDKHARIIIFVETKRNADILTRELRQDGWLALGIHGDKEQTERRYVLEEFKSGRHPIMIATDVASRGLDVKDVKVVINYDMPGQIEDYVHRIGRTGRAGATGTSYSYITQDKARLARDLIKVMQEARQSVPSDLQQLAYSPSAKSNSSRGYGGYGGRRYGGGGSGGYGGGHSSYNGGGGYGSRY